MKRSLIILLPLLFLFLSACKKTDFQPLFNGQNLEGWTPSENKDSWRVENGELITAGDRSHLFYSGEISDHNFKNFELRMEVLTKPGSNSGIYFHTEYQEEGWPEKGYEYKVINSNRKKEPGEYIERKKTGSIYGVRNTWKSPAKDNEWFKYRILVQGKTIQTFINDSLIC